MKKIITLLLVITMLIVSGISAFAAPEGFVQSPTDDTPALDSFENESDDCNATIIVTPYSKIDGLSDEKEQENRDAFDDIVNNNDSFAKAMAKLAALKNMKVSDLAVSELFDVSHYEAKGHDGHGAFTITVKAKNLDKFVGLLHCDNGEWKVVENASAKGDELTFTVDDLSPFAIVVDTNANVNPEIPNTDTQIPVLVWTCAAVIITSTVIIAFVTKQKKVKE